MASVNKIKNWIDHYNNLGYKNLKIVMTTECLNQIKSDSQFEVEENGPYTFMGLPIEIYDGIEGTDFYVTERL